jgi:hypothetical protein
LALVQARNGFSRGYAAFLQAGCDRFCRLAQAAPAAARCLSGHSGEHLKARRESAALARLAAQRY